MRRKWARGSSRGRLTFDTEPPHQPAALCAEAIIHELLHLKVPNYRGFFKALLRSYLVEVRPEAWMQGNATRTVGCYMVAADGEAPPLNRSVGRWKDMGVV